MAKRYNQRKRRGFAGDDEIAVDDTITTSSGITLKLQPVAPALLQKIEQSIPTPERPYYEAKTIFGTIEHYPHDSSTVETEEEKHMWREYSVEKYRREVELTQKGNRALLSKGVIIPKEVEEKQFLVWQEEQEWIGIEVPNKPLDRRYHFLTTEILKTPNDIITTVEKIMRLVGMDEETLQAAEDSFRSQMAT